MPCVSEYVTKWVGPALLAGDFEPLLNFFCDTVAVFTADNVYRMNGRDEMRSALATHREGLLQMGVVDMRGEIAAIGLPRGGKFRTFVDWTYELADGSARVAQATYYCVKTGGGAGARVEMLEIRKLGFEQAKSWHAGRALIRPAAAAVAENAA